MSDGQQQDPNTNDPGAQEPPVDWHDKFLGQKKVNNDLEAKLKTAYEKADRVDDLEKSPTGRSAARNSNPRRPR